MIPADIGADVDYPVTVNTTRRSSAIVEAVLELLGVELSERYRKRDITGDGIDETFCNVFARDVLRCLGVKVPRRRANEWALALLSNMEPGWYEVGPELARACANAGIPVIGIWRNPDVTKSGHVVVVRPSEQLELRCAQAGRVNFSDAPVQASGLPVKSYRFYAHH